MKTPPPAPKSATPPPPAPPTDAALVAASRRGDNTAFEQLVSRHRAAAAHLATRLAPTAHEDLLADAIATVGGALRSGGGPALCFRPYLLTTVRRRNFARASAVGRVRPIDDLAPGRTLPVAGSAVTPATLPSAAAVYRRLAEDTKVALWHTEVDQEPLRDTGLLLGMTGTEVGELAFSAREAFRQAHLAPYVATLRLGPCRWSAERFGSFAREGLNQKENDRVGDHLDDCDECRAVYPGVEAVENELRVLLAMLVLGPAAGSYLGREGAPAGRARLVLAGNLGGRARAVVGTTRAMAAVGALSLFVAAGGIVTAMTLTGSDSPTAEAAKDRGSVTESVVDDSDPDAEVAEGPDSGSASAGSDAVLRPKTRSVPVVVAAAPAAKAPAAEKSDSTRALRAPISVPDVPDVEEETQKLISDDGTVHADLGLLQVDTTKEGGLLGLLPGIQITPGSVSADTAE